MIEKIAILAAYNLENSIENIVNRTKNFVDLVIVVSDGSKDKTNLKARMAGAKCPPETTKRGKGFAVRKGIGFSKQFNPRYIVLMDADGQHLPEQIPLLLSPVQTENIDMVVGSRFKGKIRTSTINKIGNFILKFISFFITKKWYSDTESGFRAFKAIKLYNLELKATYYEIEGEFLIRALKKGYKIKEVPIIVPKKVPGVTIKHGIIMGLYKLKLSRQLRK